MKIKYSVVVPCFNEQETIKPFYMAIIPVMEQTKSAYEIIFVNDGSHDKSEELLNEIALADKRVKVLHLSKNFGKQSAILAGLAEASGEAVITIDVDLEDPVEVILDMVSKWKMGFDIVHGKYLSRKSESKTQRRKAKRFTNFFEKVTGMRLPKNCSDFKLFDRKVVDAILSMPEKNRFLCGMTEWVGFTHTFVEYDRQLRSLSSNKNKSKKFVEDALSDVVSNSNYPLSFSLKFGISFATLSVLGFIALIVLVCVKISVPLVAWLFPTATLLASIGYILSGLQNLYITRIYSEVQKRPLYLIRQKLNCEPAKLEEKISDGNKSKTKKKNYAKK